MKKKRKRRKRVYGFQRTGAALGILRRRGCPVARRTLQYWAFKGHVQILRPEGAWYRINVDQALELARQTKAYRQNV